MQSKFVLKQLQRTNLNLLLTNLAVVLGLGIALFANRDFLYNFWRGPFRINSVDILSLTEPPKGQQQYFRVNDVPRRSPSQNAAEEELRLMHTLLKQGTATDTLRVISIDNKLLIVKTESSEPATSYAGVFKEPGFWADLKFKSEVNQLPPGVIQSILPVMLDTTEYPANGYIGMGIGAIALIVSLFNLNGVRRRYREPERHPLIKSLARQGSAKEVGRSIDAEMQAPTVQVGSVTVTHSWLVQSSYFSVNVLALRQIVWAYEKQTTHRKFFIPLFKTYELILCDDTGTSIPMSMNHRQVEVLNQKLLLQNPWMLTSFSKDLQKQWSSNQAKFIETIVQRREAWEQANHRSNSN